MDDGMILRESETRFVLSFTSGGAANAEMWLRDWIEVWGLRVHILDRTMSLAAINVTGPLARTLLVRAGLADPPRFLGHLHADVAGVPCHVMRLSFTGEAAFELHHPVDRSVELWRALMVLGGDLGIRPHGLQALFGLRLEKGHVIVGMDTELDTTPRRLGMDWAVRMEKPRFIGRASLERTAKLPDHRRWVGFTMDGPAPTEGAPIWSGGEVRPLHRGSLPLGMMASMSVLSVRSAVFQPGDCIVCYTDGILERTNAGGEQFAEDRLAGFIRMNSGLDAGTIVGRLFDEVEKFAEGSEPDDDATVAVVRFT
jgi:sarcosine oxidase subunit alpha